MVDEQTSGAGAEGEDQEDQEEEAGQASRLTQAQRRERLSGLAAQIGEHAQQDGDVVVVEAGEPVVLHLELSREGEYTATWWATALTDSAHHRWRDAAAELLHDGEAIHTSALGGGYLVEIERSTRDEGELLAWAGNSEQVDRVRELLRAFPEAVANLPEEPTPDYLLPPEPELPPLGEVDEGVIDEASSEEESEDAEESQE